jgi:hypothetical protein
MIDEKRCFEFPKIDELVALSIKENCRRLRSEIIKFSALQKSQGQEVLNYEQRKECPNDR